jgi:hypothetical protein
VVVVLFRGLMSGKGEWKTNEKSTTQSKGRDRG